METHILGGDEAIVWEWNMKYVKYLVDPASSHMLVSKIKPCMSKYKCVDNKAANGSLKQL